jgi:hypothetical protein
MWKLVFNVANVIFNLEVLKGKLTKSIWIMSHVKLSKNMLLGQRNWKTNKICNSYGLMKISLNFYHWNQGVGCLHTMVTLHGHHNDNFSYIPYIQEKYKIKFIEIM